MARLQLHSTCASSVISQARVISPSPVKECAKMRSFGGDKQRCRACTFPGIAWPGSLCTHGDAPKHNSLVAVYNNGSTAARAYDRRLRGIAKGAALHQCL